MNRYIDIHSHVALDMFGSNSDEVFKAMREEGIATIVVGVNLETSKQAIACAEAHENVFATVGVHPNETSGGDFVPRSSDNRSDSFELKVFRDLIKHPKVVAVGECGLDYYRLTTDEPEDVQKERQKNLFLNQIAISGVQNKPLMIHGRPSIGSMDAYDDILEILDTNSAQTLQGNIHFFVGTSAIAQKFFDRNFTVSFPGVITFSSDYDDVVKSAPRHMIHAETDSPYATPVPYRGKRNDPRYLPLIVSRMAQLRGEDEEELRIALLENARRVFGVV